MGLQHIARGLCANPGFTAVVCLTLALGIGANTAIFSLVDAVLLRPLPYPRPHELVSVKIDLNGLNLTNVGMGVPELDDLRDHSGAFAEISAVRPISANLTGSDRPERIEALGVSPNYFALLGATAQLGRVFGEQDRVPGFADAVILGDGIWRRLFGGDRAILGRKLRLDTDLYTVVGVMKPGFRHPGISSPRPVEMWITTGFSGKPFPPPDREARVIPAAIGRLKPGLPLEQAQIKLQLFAADLSRRYPANYPQRVQWTARLVTLKEEVTGNLKTTLLVVFGAVVCVLMTCCVSVANLVVARCLGRQREIAVRRALGAPWSVLIRQLIYESLTISLFGGCVSWLTVKWAEPWLPGLVPLTLPVSEIAVNSRVLAFAIGAAVLTGVVFGLAPVVPMMQTDIVANLKEGGRGSTVGATHNRFRTTLVAGEIALSLILMATAGLLLHSFWKISRLNLGFNPKNVLVANLRLPFPNDASAGRYLRTEARTPFIREVLRRVRELPGVEWAAIGNGDSTPLSGFNAMRFRPEGYPARRASG